MNPLNLIQVMLAKGSGGFFVLHFSGRFTGARRLGIARWGAMECPMKCGIKWGIQGGAKMWGRG